MCDFVSWIEFGDYILFLTNLDLETKRGRELMKFLGNKFDEDIKGHGAIEWYYELTIKGIHRECTDFSLPGNFPSKIVNAIKSGEMSYIGVPIDRLNLLEKTARDAYNAAVKKTFWAIFSDPKNRKKCWR